jgi:hypothetical protein
MSFLSKGTDNRLCHQMHGAKKHAGILNELHQDIINDYAQVEKFVVTYA